MKINDVLVEGPVLQAKKPAQQPDEMGRVEPTMNPQQQQVQQPAQQPAPAQQQAQQPAPTQQAQQPAPAQQPAQQPAPQQQQVQQSAQQKTTVGQINKAIPKLRTRDLQSVKKTVDTTIAQKSKQPAQPAPAAPAQDPAQQAQQQAQDPAQPANPQQQVSQAGQFTDEYGNLDPTKLSPEQIRGYEFVNGKLVKKNPSLFTRLGQSAKNIVQGALGNKQDYRLGIKQDTRNPTPNFYHDTMKNASALKSLSEPQPTQPPAPEAEPEKVEPTMEPQSASGIAKGMRNAGKAPAQQQWINTGNGTQISPATNSHPTLGKHGKQLYSLNDKDQWIDQKGKPASVAISTVLNKALEQT